MNWADLSWSEILLVRVVWSELSLGRVVLHPLFPYLDCIFLGLISLGTLGHSVLIEYIKKDSLILLLHLTEYLANGLTNAIGNQFALIAR